MKYQELTKRLRALGCQEERSAKGSHIMWLNQNNGRKTAIANWGGKDIPPGTVRGILRQLGIERKEFGPIK